MSGYATFDFIFPCARGTESMLALPLLPVFKNNSQQQQHSTLAVITKTCLILLYTIDVNLLH